MYLKEVHIENKGSLSNTRFSVAFDGEQPKPVILIGGNGAGKTNIISIIADALIEAAIQGHTDIVKDQETLNRPFFRMVGGDTTRIGQNHSISLLRFQNNGQDVFYKERSGTINQTDLQARVSSTMRAGATTDSSQIEKVIGLSDEQSRKIFNVGVYAYFPTNRAEPPAWLNVDSLHSDAFSVYQNLASVLRKPIFVERSLENFRSWLLSVILEARTDFLVINQNQFQLAGDVPKAVVASSVVSLANKILSTILCDDTVRFVWLGRHGGTKLSVAKGENLFVPNINCLSDGQMTLLSIFGTLLRYGDHPRFKGGLNLNELHGICLIDEIDAHIHIELQQCALPKLIKMFPNIQFIITSHSPLFLLGIEQEFGPNGVQILELPDGVPVPAEAFSEFKFALEAFKKTKAFANSIFESVADEGKLLVLTEGETDPKYIITAAELLGRADFVEACDIDWVGEKNPQTGSARFGGKDSLNQALAFLKANPGLVKRKLVLLYDPDTNKPAEQHGNVYVRTMPKNPDATLSSGVEQLLTPECIEAQFYEIREDARPDGGKNLKTSLDKTRLRDHLCNVRRNPDDFTRFGEVIDLIMTIAND